MSIVKIRTAIALNVEKAGSPAKCPHCGKPGKNLGNNKFKHYNKKTHLAVKYVSVSYCGGHF